MIGNTPYNRRDLRIANNIYGRSVSSLKGKSTKQKSKLPREDETSDLPPHIVEHYKEVHLGIDIFFVNQMPFMFTFSKHIGLMQVSAIRGSSMEAVLDVLYKMIAVYTRRGFRVKTIQADGNFECIKAKLEEEPNNIKVTICDADKHVQFMERQIRVIKERIRAVKAGLPYTKYPRRLLASIVERVVLLVNSLPRENGIHTVLSPREIVTGNKLRYPKVKLGSYVQAIVGGTNDTDVERSIDGLYIGRSDNGSGHQVLKIKTMRVVSVNRVTEIPIPQEIINKINELGTKQKQSEGITFQDMGGSTTLSELHLDMDTGERDGNVSDDDYELTSDDDREIEQENKYEEVGIDATETQGDHFFQQPEQHHDFDDDELEE